MVKHLLGIDVGFANLGICAFEFRAERNPQLVKVHVIRTKPNKTKQNLRKTDDDLSRAYLTWLALEKFIWKTEPFGDRTIAAVEMPHGGAQGARANRLMGMASTLVAGWLWNNGIPFEHYSPGDIKKFTTGTFKGSKAQVRIGICDRLDSSNLKKLTEVIQDYPKGVHEHIVDAVATGWLAYEQSDLVKAFLS